MKVKELIEFLEQFDEESSIELDNVNYLENYGYEYYDIEEIYFEERNCDNAVVFSLKKGDWVRWGGRMKIKEVEKLLSACEVDFEELKNNVFRNPSDAKEDDTADINAMLINRIRKNINSRLFEIENGRYRWNLKNYKN